MNLIFLIAILYRRTHTVVDRIGAKTTHKIIVILIQFLLFIEPIIANYTIYVEQYCRSAKKASLACAKHIIRRNT